MGAGMGVSMPWVCCWSICGEADCCEPDCCKFGRCRGGRRSGVWPNAGPGAGPNAGPDVGLTLCPAVDDWDGMREGVCVLTGGEGVAVKSDIMGAGGAMTGGAVGAVAALITGVVAALITGVEAGSGAGAELPAESCMGGGDAFTVSVVWVTGRTGATAVLGVTTGTAGTAFALWLCAVEPDRVVSGVVPDFGGAVVPACFEGAREVGEAGEAGEVREGAFPALLEAAGVVRFGAGFTPCLVPVAGELYLGVS